LVNCAFWRHCRLYTAQRERIPSFLACPARLFWNQSAHLQFLSYGKSEQKR
jgi:hypothetical protein